MEEEMLYSIKIYKENGSFIGETYSEIDGEKKFESIQLGEMLRDMINDIQLSLDDSINQFENYSVPE